MNTVDFSYSATALRTGLSNEIPAKYFDNVRKTIVVFDYLSKKLKDNCKIEIGLTSGFRTEKVNALVGGSKSSAHAHGLAFDFDFSCYYNSNKKKSKLDFTKDIYSFLKSSDFNDFCSMEKTYLDQCITYFNKKVVSDLEVTLLSHIHLGFALSKKDARRQFFDIVK